MKPIDYFPRIITEIKGEAIIVRKGRKYKMIRYASKASRCRSSSSSSSSTKIPSPRHNSFQL